MLAGTACRIHNCSQVASMGSMHFLLSFFLLPDNHAHIFLSCSTGRLLCHWDPSWSWAQLQLVASCHGPGNTILILTAARVVFLVAHNGDKHQAGSSAGVTEAAASSGGSSGGFTQQQLQLQQQQVLEKYSIKVGKWGCSSQNPLQLLAVCGLVPWGVRSTDGLPQQ